MRHYRTGRAIRGSPSLGRSPPAGGLDARRLQLPDTLLYRDFRDPPQNFARLADIGQRIASVARTRLQMHERSADHRGDSPDADIFSATDIDRTSVRNR